MPLADLHGAGERHRDHARPSDNAPKCASTANGRGRQGGIAISATALPPASIDKPPIRRRKPCNQKNNSHSCSGNPKPPPVSEVEKPNFLMQHDPIRPLFRKRHLAGGAGSHRKPRRGEGRFGEPRQAAAHDNVGAAPGTGSCSVSSKASPISPMKMRWMPAAGPWKCKGATAMGGIDGVVNAAGIVIHGTIVNYFERLHVNRVNTRNSIVKRVYLHNSLCDP